jgi:hypothetical protein
VGEHSSGFASSVHRRFRGSRGTHQYVRTTTKDGQEKDTHANKHRGRDSQTTADETHSLTKHAHATHTRTTAQHDAMKSYTTGSSILGLAKWIYSLNTLATTSLHHGARSTMAGVDMTTLLFTMKSSAWGNGNVFQGLEQWTLVLKLRDLSNKAPVQIHWDLYASTSPMLLTRRSIPKVW